MENPEEVLHSLEEFVKAKPKEIPRELDDYLVYVAKTGDPVFKWGLIKALFREKLIKVIGEFYESTLTVDIPQYPNVDPFNYERMKNCLLEKLEAFLGAPFTVQRISELLTNPRKEYNRVDKFMRAIEKNILVVSTREPGNAEENVATPDSGVYNGMEGTFPCADLEEAPPIYGSPLHPSESVICPPSEVKESQTDSKPDESEPSNSESEPSNSESEPSNSESEPENTPILTEEKSPEPAQEPEVLPSSDEPSPTEEENTSPKEEEMAPVEPPVLREASVIQEPSTNVDSSPSQDTDTIQETN